MTAASANACWPPTAWEQGGKSSHGVESPSDVRALDGSASWQFTAFGSRAAAEFEAAGALEAAGVDDTAVCDPVTIML